MVTHHFCSRKGTHEKEPGKLIHNIVKLVFILQHTCYQNDEQLDNFKVQGLRLINFKYAVKMKLSFGISFLGSVLRRTLTEKFLRLKQIIICIERKVGVVLLLVVPVAKDNFLLQVRKNSAF